MQNYYELPFLFVIITAIHCVQPSAVIQIQIQSFGFNLAVVGLYLFTVYEWLSSLYKDKKT